MAGKNPDQIKKYNSQYAKTLVGRFRSGKSGAIRRKMEWLLTLNEYSDLIKDGLCHYCNLPINEQGSGLDRKNDEFYYSMENSVPCCAMCNSTFIMGFKYEEKLKLGVVLREIYLERKNQHH